MGTGKNLGHLVWGCTLQGVCSLRTGQSSCPKEVSSIYEILTCPSFEHFHKEGTDTRLDFQSVFHTNFYLSAGRIHGFYQETTQNVQIQVHFSLLLEGTFYSCRYYCIVYIYIYKLFHTILDFLDFPQSRCLNSQTIFFPERFGNSAISHSIQRTELLHFECLRWQQEGMLGRLNCSSDFWLLLTQRSQAGFKLARSRTRCRVMMAEKSIVVL